MGRARLHGPSPQIRLPWLGVRGAGVGGTGLSQQLPELEGDGEAGGHGGNIPPLTGHHNNSSDDNNNKQQRHQQEGESDPHLVRAKHCAEYHTHVMYSMPLPL